MRKNSSHVVSTILCTLIFASSSIYADDINAENLAYIVSPQDGATVSSPVKVIFGLSAPYGVAPAGTVMDNTGHHHLVIDADLPNLEMPIPKDNNYRHFGGGQTEASIELSPGEHTLQLLLGDFKHVPHADPIISEQIRVIVK